MDATGWAAQGHDLEAEGHRVEYFEVGCSPEGGLNGGGGGGGKEIKEKGVEKEEEREVVKQSEDMQPCGESWSTYFCLEQAHLSETRCTYLGPGRHKPLQLLVLVTALKRAGFMTSGFGLRATEGIGQQLCPG